MGIFGSLSKLISKTSGIADPVSSVLRKQGGTLGAVGGFLNPGAAAADKFAAGAPITGRNMLDPGNFVNPAPAAGGAQSPYTPYQPSYGGWQKPTQTREQMIAQILQAHNTGFPGNGAAAPGPQAPPMGAAPPPLMPNSVAGGPQVAMSGPQRITPFPGTPQTPQAPQMPALPPMGMAQQPPIMGLQRDPRMMGAVLRR